MICSKWIRRIVEISVLLVFLSSFCITPQSQSPTAPQETPPRLHAAPSDYSIGPGDILEVDVTPGFMPKGSEDELVAKFRVMANGDIQIPTVPTPIKAEGLTTAALANRIAHALEEAKQFRDPVVRVFVDEFHSKTVTLLGAIEKPTVYSLEKETRLLDVLATGGGLAPNAGNTITVVHQGQSAGSAKSQTIDLAALLKGKDPSLNVEVHNGDVIDVSTAPIIYVVGAVNKPGGFPVLDPGSGITVLQALAMAEGATSLAAKGRCLIVRGSVDSSGRRNIPLNLNNVMEGKNMDLRLQANDILFVPESGVKRTEQRMGEVAVQAINGISVYGIGYRIAGVH